MAPQQIWARFVKTRLDWGMLRFGLLHAERPNECGWGEIGDNANYGRFQGLWGEGKVQGRSSVSNGLNLLLR